MQELQESKKKLEGELNLLKEKVRSEGEKAEEVKMLQSELNEK